MGDMVMDKTEENALVSQIVITFQEPGSVNMQIEFKNVIPLQGIAAAWLLQKQAEGGFIQQQMAQQQQEERSKIAVPTLQPRQPILKPK